MAGVAFTPNFLRLEGQRSYIEEFPAYPDGRPEYDNGYYGHFSKILGLYPSLDMNANSPGPTLYLRPFR